MFMFFIILAVDCGTVLNVSSASVIGNANQIDTTFGSTVVQYACHEGFTSQASVTSSCLSNATWSVPEYSCEGTADCALKVSLMILSKLNCCILFVSIYS